jgi:hypothetical protein
MAQRLGLTAHAAIDGVDIIDDDDVAIDVSSQLMVQRLGLTA